MQINNSWIAGFFEGDGWVGETGGSPRVGLYQKNIEPLEAVRDFYKPRFEGSLRKRENGVWALVYSGGEAVSVFGSLATQLSPRRNRQASEAKLPSTKSPYSFTFSEEELWRWRAGFHEAEGWIGLRSNGRKDYLYPTLHITQYERPHSGVSAEDARWPLLKFGGGEPRGPYSAGKHGRVSHVLRLNAAHTEEFFRNMRPHLSSKKILQGEEALRNSTVGREPVGKLTSQDRQDIRWRRESHSESVADIADSYGVTAGRVYQILRSDR
ncbi:MAG: LAGLIDADG family homing endonuclease [Actinobacteria bacterium]|nr:LAGLIDADG family homing endonuclease [Actinomycetota bacterium]